MKPCSYQGHELDPPSPASKARSCGTTPEPCNTAAVSGAWCQEQGNLGQKMKPPESISQELSAARSWKGRLQHSWISLEASRSEEILKTEKSVTCGGFSGIRNRQYITVGLRGKQQRCKTRSF